MDENLHGVLHDNHVAIGLLEILFCYDGNLNLEYVAVIHFHFALNSRVHQLQN